MKISLIYPPEYNRNCETFSLPNISIATLANYLIKNGYKNTTQHDLDILYFKKIKKIITDEQREKLENKEKVIAYCNDKLTKKEKEEFDFLINIFLKEGKIGKSDIIGITFSDLRTDFFLANISALIAKMAKDKWKTKIVIGYRSIPHKLYIEIMEKYKVFDYAVFSNFGEEPLLRIIEKIKGKNVELINTIENNKGDIKTHYNLSNQFPVCPTPYYEKDILKNYEVEERQLINSYYSQPKIVSEIFNGNNKEIIVPYSFINTCSGTCAFCANDPTIPSNSKSVNQVIDEIGKMKEAGVTGIYFINSNFNDKYSFADKLCDEMIKNNFNILWTDCANLRNIDENLLLKMKKAGAIKITFGMETASNKLLKYIRKGITVEKIEKYLKLTHKLGIFTHIELIGGLPYEDETDIRNTIEFIERNTNYIDIYSLNPFYLYSSSPFARMPQTFGLEIIQTRNQKPNFYKSPEKIGIISGRFNEINGLKWEDKDKQIIESTKRISDTIKKVSSHKFIDFEHVYLLTFLYRKLGWEKKELIRKLVKIMITKFKPYNVDSFISEVNYIKHTYSRDLI